MVQLEHLVFSNLWFSQTHLPALAEVTPSFKVKEITLTALGEHAEDKEDVLLKAFKRNYSLLRVQCKSKSFICNSTLNWFSDARQAHLNFYLDRNHKLAEWTKNPKLVPQELWSYAVALALEAGINSLFQSLIALLGLGVGLKQANRKRKPSQDFDSSSNK